jgi:hypothetical protein
MFTGLRYYWVTAKGYRLCPWHSPYLRWRLETYLGKQPVDMDARVFLALMWRERGRMRLFLGWVAERRREQKLHGQFHENYRPRANSSPFARTGA